MRRLIMFPGLVIALLVTLAAGPLTASQPLPPARAQGETIPLPVAAPGEHPRLLITRSYIDGTLKPRVANIAPAWAAFATYVQSGEPEQDAEWTPGTALRSLALAWLVTGNDAYADRAKAIMISLINRIESDPVMLSQGGLNGQFMEDIAAAALGYDWLHDALTPADQSALQETLLRAATRLLDQNADTDSLIWLDGRLMAFGNYEPRWLWALTAVALALMGEHENAPALANYARNALNETVIPALDLQTGGGWAEGPVYGFIANWPRVQTALAWWTALGENHFDDTGWWYDRLAYDMFLYYPTMARTYNQEWGDLIHDYPSIIGDSERYHTAAVYGRAQDLILRTVFAGTPHSSWMDWFLDQPPEGMPNWMIVEEFLWRDPVSTGFAPPPLTWIAPYNGHVFMRSNWADEAGGLDPTATYVSFNAGDHLAYHQFYDQGSFTIFHNGADLVARSGVYSGDGTSDHDANYYVRTIAGNTILVCDLGEDFDGIRPNGERDVWLNDCGQRTMRPHSRTAINVDVLVENWQTYDTGSLLRYGDVGSVTYLRADLTGAYNSTFYATPENSAKVDQVIREFVYWRPGTVIVSDRVKITYPSYTPMTVFHFQAEPVPAGVFFQVSVGNSVLYLQNMLPNSLATVVEGYEVAGQLVDQSWGEPVGNNFEDQPYAPYRLEITPGALDLKHWFLTTLIAQDAAAPPPSESVTIMGDGMRGVANGTTQVMFDLEPGDGQDIMQTRFQVQSGVQYTLVTGLVPGVTYLVQGEGRLSKTVTTDDAGLALLVDIPAGPVRLMMQ